MSRIVLPEFPQTWTTVRIGDIARVVYGDALTAEMRNSEGGVNVYGSGGIVGKHDVSLHPGPSIIIGRKGSVGSIYLETQPFWCIDTAFYLDWISDQIDIEFLFYLLAFLDLRRLAIVVGVPGLNRADLESTEIPLPTLLEQQRIVAILRQAEELRQLREKALEEIQQLPSALFLKMFGDPVMNPKGWSLVKVSSFVKNFQGGKSIESESSDNSDSVFRVLKVSAITSLIYKPQESKPLPSGYVPPPEHIVRKGDLLFSRANTSELVGAVAYVWETPDNILLSDKLWRFVWSTPEEIEPLFIWSLFSNPSFRFEIGKRATGTSGSMKNISQEKVLAMQIPFPNYPLQKKFATFVQSIKAIQDFYSRSRNQAENLFISLQQRAFSGDLTPAWRGSHLQELAISSRTRDAALGQVVGKVTFTEHTPLERPWLSQPERYWLLNHLGEVQGFLWEALREWKGTLVPSDDLEEFREKCFPIAHLENASDHIFRALSQLAGLGLIAQVNVPNQQGEYVIGYRGLREDERLRTADLQSVLESQR